MSNELQAISLENVNFWKVHHDVYFVHNGKLVSADGVEELLNAGNRVQICFRLRGGKGGFGSLLRAIGSQIDKTTNREMCRDLTGRRMRDVNNEKKLKEWSAKAADRVAEAESAREERRERRREQLRLLRAAMEGKPDDGALATKRQRLEDRLYMRQHEAAADGIQSALSAARSTSTSTETKSSSAPLTKQRRWMDELEEDLGSSDNSIDSDDSDLDDVISEAFARTRQDATPKVEIEEASTSQSFSSASVVVDEEGNTFPIIEVEHEPCTPVCASVTSCNEPASHPVDEDRARPDESVAVVFEAVDLSLLNTLEEVEALGADRLKNELLTRGLKCGGTLAERATRLFAVRHLLPEEYPPSLCVRKPNIKSKSRS